VVHQGVSDARTAVAETLRGFLRTPSVHPQTSSRGAEHPRRYSGVTTGNIAGGTRLFKSEEGTMTTIKRLFVAGAFRLAVKLHVTQKTSPVRRGERR